MNNYGFRIRYALYDNCLYVYDSVRASMRSLCTCTLRHIFQLERILTVAQGELSVRTTVGHKYEYFIIGVVRHVNFAFNVENCNILTLTQCNKVQTDHSRITVDDDDRVIPVRFVRTGKTKTNCR